MTKRLNILNILLGLLTLAILTAAVCDIGLQGGLTEYAVRTGYGPSKIIFMLITRWSLGLGLTALMLAAGFKYEQAYKPLFVLIGLSAILNFISMALM